MRILQHDAHILGSYARIPSRFTVDAIYEVTPLPRGMGGFELTEKRLEAPYVDDYDDHDHPTNWLKMGWDLSKWGFFVAYEGDEMVGGAIVAYDTDGVHMLQGRRDLACLWDIRVHPDWRRKGIGKALLAKARDFASAKHCRYLKIETQNTNVRANRFYQSQGCVLGGINLYAYQSYPAQVQLLWFYVL
jgi:ribosomal protein S18 acetylase RimI-like enzyme